MSEKKNLWPVLMVAGVCAGLLRLIAGAPFKPSVRPRFDLQQPARDAAKALEALRTLGAADLSAQLGAGVREAPSVTSGTVTLPVQNTHLQLRASLTLTPSSVVLSVRNEAKDTFLAEAEADILCGNGPLGGFRRKVTLRNLRPGDISTELVPEEARTCAKASEAGLAVANEQSFPIHPEAVSAAALATLREASSSQASEARLDFLAAYFTPRGGRALLVAHGSAKKVESGRLRAMMATKGGRDFLALALRELLNPHSYLTRLVQAPADEEPLLGLANALDAELLEEVLAVTAGTLDFTVRNWRRREERADGGTSDRSGIGGQELTRAAAHLRASQLADRLGAWRENNRNLRRQKTLSSIIEALSLGAAEDPDGLGPWAAAALVEALAVSDDGRVAELAKALGGMPQLAAPALARRLASPTGDERRWLWEPFESLGTRAELSTSVASALGYSPDESRARHQAAQTRRSDELFAAAEVEGDLVRRLSLVRESIRRGGPARRLIAPALASADEARDGGDLRAAIALVEEVLSLDPAHSGARAQREHLEEAVIGRLLQGPLLFEGPSAEYPTFEQREAHSAPPWATRAVDGFTLVHYRGSLAFRPPTGPQLAEHVLARLDLFGRRGLSVRGSTWLRARLLASVWWRPLAVSGGLLLLAALALTLISPWLAAGFLRHFGLGRWATGLSRWCVRRIRKGSPGVHEVRLLLKLAGEEPGLAASILEQAEETTQLNCPTHLAGPLLGRIAFLRGNLTRAEALHRQFLSQLEKRRDGASPSGDGRGPALARDSHHDLARISFARGSDGRAVEHAEEAGWAGSLVGGCARLRLGSPSGRFFARASVVGSQRNLARALWAHALIDQGQLTWARCLLAITSRSEPRAEYARARLLHAQGRKARAQAAYHALIQAKPTHTGAWLGIALLEEGPARKEHLTSLAKGRGLVATQARLALARDALATEKTKEAVELLGNTHAPRSADEAALQGALFARASSFPESAAAYEDAQQRRPSRSAKSLLALRRAALAAKAMQEEASAQALALLRNQADPFGMLPHAESHALFAEFRRAPHQGLKKVAQSVLRRPVEGVPSEFEAHLQICLVLSSFLTGRSEKPPIPSDPLALLLWSLLGSAQAVGQTDVRQLAARARACHPSLSTPIGLLEASFCAGRGALEEARGIVANAASLDDESSPTQVCLAGLAVRLDMPGEGLVRVMAKANTRRYREVCAEWAARPTTKTLSAPAVSMRLAVGAQAALECLQSGDLKGALTLLHSTLEATKPSRQLLPKEALPRHLLDLLRTATLELRAEAWSTFALHQPDRALRLLRGRKADTDEMRSAIRHDRAIVALASCLEQGIAASPRRVLRMLARFDSLMKNRRGLSPWRLRLLELCEGTTRASGAQLEDALRERTVDLLASVLRALLEKADSGRVREILEAYGGESSQDSMTNVARRRVEDGESEGLALALDTAQARAEEVRDKVEAVRLWEEIEASILLSMGRLEALVASDAVLSHISLKVEHFLDFLSVKFYASFPSSGLGVAIIDRGLTLRPSESKKAHFIRNRVLMGGGGTTSSTSPGGA